MNSRTCLWVALLAYPALASAAEPAKPGFDLRASSVQSILRATVANEAKDSPEAKTESRVESELAGLRFRAPRCVHHTKCDGEECVAYNADNEPLFTLDREMRQDLDAMSAKQLDDAWLSCQDTNNLLSTFERFDRCRGIRIGLPPVHVRP